MSLMRRLYDVNIMFRRRSSSASIPSGRRTPEVDDEKCESRSECGDVLTPLPLARKLNMSPRWSKVKTNSRNLRRTKSVNVTPSSTSASAPGNKAIAMATKVDTSPEASPASRRKKHKALLVKKIAAKDIEDPALTGYMERKNISEQWLRYWFVLKGSSLFCYLTPDDTMTVDLLDVRGYRGECLVDRFRGKRFVLHLTHEEYVSIHLSVDSRDDMEEWRLAIQTAAGASPSQQAEMSETVAVDPQTDGATYEDKCVSVKRKLLNEMLRQKHELERKQAARQRRSQGVESPNKDLSSVEKQITYATHIRQRRLSTQIKMETIAKQLQSQSTSNKRFPFSFGGKKKNNNQEHLKGQLEELNNKLQQIDLDLTSHINKTTSNSDLLDMNQNRKSNGNGVHEPELRVSDDVTSSARLPTGNSNNTKDDSDMNKTNTLKNSVQKLAQKTFSRNVKSKKSKRSNDGDSAITNGYLSDSMVIDRHRHGLENGDISNEYDSDEGTDTQKADSLTDLTTTSTSNISDDNVFDSKLESDGTKFKSRKSNSSYSSNSSTHSQSSTTRKEVDPSIMAEIDAFEDFTKQILGRKMVTS